MSAVYEHCEHLKWTVHCVHRSYVKHTHYVHCRFCKGLLRLREDFKYLLTLIISS